MAVVAEGPSEELTTTPGSAGVPQAAETTPGSSASCADVGERDVLRPGEHVPPCPRLSDSELISRSNLKGDRRFPCPCRPQFQESREMWARPRQHERFDCLQRIANQLVAERDRMRSGVLKKQRTLGDNG